MIIEIESSGIEVEAVSVRAYVPNPELPGTYNVNVTEEGVIVDVVDASGEVIGTAQLPYDSITY